MLEFIGERIKKAAGRSRVCPAQLKWQMVLGKATNPAAFAPSAAPERDSSEEDQ
jgi:hypothetical protein